MPIDELTTPVMTCSISLLSSEGDQGEMQLKLRFDWIMGVDRVLFESFSGHVYRMLEKNTHISGRFP
jgi:hypothetical protein